MSTPHNPNDPSNQQSGNEPWGQQSGNEPWGQQPVDPQAGQSSWSEQDQSGANQWDHQPQQSADQWGNQPQQPADQWTGQQGAYGEQGAYGGGYGQQSAPYANQQQWTGQPQQPTGMTSDGKSFFSALFDFGFQSFVTPKIIKVVYIVLTAVIGLGVLFFLIGALLTGEALNIIAALILAPLIGLIYLALARMSLELYYAVIRLSEDVHERLPRQ